MHVVVHIKFQEYSKHLLLVSFVFLTFFYKTRFSIWSGPKPNTIADFWQMIWQNGVCNIVCLTNLKEGTKVTMYRATSNFPNHNIIFSYPLFFPTVSLYRGTVIIFLQSQLLCKLWTRTH